MKKRILGILLALTIVIVGVGCSKNQNVDKVDQVESTETTKKESETKTEDKAEDKTETAEKEEKSVEELKELRVMAPNGTPTLSMIKLINDKYSPREGTEVTYENIASPELLVTKLTQQEADIAIVPTNLAANLYQKGVPYQLAGSSVWGILYLVSNQEVASWEDLKGKEIALIGRGLTPDATFRYLLSSNGIDPEKDVTLKYYASGSELAASYIAGQDQYSLIPQPILTKVLMKKKDSKIVLDMQKEWSKVTGLESYPQASIIVSKALVESHPQVVEDFLQAYDEAVDWENENPQEAGTYYENLNIGLNAALINKAMPGCNLDFVATKEAKEALEAYFKVLFEFNPKLLGGKLPDEGLYYEK